MASALDKAICESLKDFAKDLVIWPSPWDTCFDDGLNVARYPLAVIEWTVRHPKKKVADIKAAFDYDRAWIEAFSSGCDSLGRPESTYAVLLTLTSRQECLVASRAVDGKLEPDWLAVSPGRSG